MGDEVLVVLRLQEIGWLMATDNSSKLGSLLARAAEGDPIARSLYRKLKAGAIACGVRWIYGDPWDLEQEEDPRS